MKHNQQNSMNMHEAVIDHFDENPLSWQTKLPVVNVFNDVRSCYEQLIGTSLVQQQGATTGYTKQKNQQKGALINLAYNMGIKLKGYAKITHNAVLLQAVDYSVSDLNGSREQDLVNICQTLYDKGVEFAPVAVDHEISVDELTALQTAITVFKPMGIKRDRVGDKRTIATGDVEILLKEMVRLLDLLDTLIESLITDQAFVAGYFQARKITDRNGGGKGGDEEESPEV